MTNISHYFKGIKVLYKKLENHYGKEIFKTLWEGIKGDTRKWAKLP